MTHQLHSLAIGSTLSEDEVHECGIACDASFPNESCLRKLLLEIGPLRASAYLGADSQGVSIGLAFWIAKPRKVLTLVSLGREENRGEDPLRLTIVDLCRTVIVHFLVARDQGKAKDTESP